MPDANSPAQSRCSDIVLATLNAKYIHTAFGLRYLYANMGELQAQTSVVEFTIHDRPADVVEKLLQLQPKIVGLGVYIWNTEQTRRVVEVLRRVAPEVRVVLGGPEVSYEWQEQALVALADVVVTGEGDATFPQVCATLLAGQVPPNRVVPGVSPPTDTLRLPYATYSADDIRHRTIYVEASRGCPFKCEFCLSSLDSKVRRVNLPDLLKALESLIERGAKQFKFVDRTFNLSLEFSRTLLDFFYERYFPGMFLHFEMVPDRLPEGLRQAIARFPAGAIQLEIGIQTFNPDVGARISRRQDYTKLADNLRFLRQHTGVHMHTDLIVGLPGESLESFAQGFDTLVALNPQEIQVGILKRLRGTPISRHSDAFDMVYDTVAPYEILRSRDLSFDTLQKLKRFARYWDMVANSGRFAQTMALLWQAGTPFKTFLGWSDWLYRTTGQTHRIALDRLAQYLFTYLTESLGVDPDMAGPVVLADYQRGAPRKVPPLLTRFATPVRSKLTATDSGKGLGKGLAEQPSAHIPKRQALHLAAQQHTAGHVM